MWNQYELYFENAIKRDEAIKQLSNWHPELNIENLIRVKWIMNNEVPVFYIEIPF